MAADSAPEELSLGVGGDLGHTVRSAGAVTKGYPACMKKKIQIVEKGEPSPIRKKVELKIQKSPLVYRVYLWYDRGLYRGGVGGHPNHARAK